MKFNELDMVQLKVDIASKKLKAGNEGTIVEIVEGKEEIYNVEFETADGNLIYAEVKAADLAQIEEGE